METISHFPCSGQERQEPPLDRSSVAESAYDQFVAREELQEVLNRLRWVSSHPAAHKYERYLLECPERGENRMMLAHFARAQLRETFIGTVGVRGFIGKHRNVLLENLRIFGSKFVCEHHVWIPYGRHWARIEPFFQGQKIVLVATARDYTRKNGTCDYTLAVEKVTKL